MYYYITEWPDIPLFSVFRMGMVVQRTADFASAVAGNRGNVTRAGQLLEG